ncbi:M16 family metallopeptidase [Deinococcus radiodurans]|uniref:M16 family metallopeptidase n=1 Tax=Deinococcus radiodurans TaxID=1299 RepID=UPI000484A991|nr:pitrilysin family protein [Deinococcus radiodurans]ANC70453.1 peptidase M16 [Deinococcus radiodurans R1 = ATCC 13939 = DSM 20539]QIP28161.1 insulinase family protein [Deinococcus radiodurans]QIP30960.1 insulinase family protein [Deinococcus radiodurans]UID71472.1 peptidase M16 [Deinococcus radiodurans R1 = ATCC 13939 = DSM 20539]UTA51800.1 insulinase family protein [Deinococcus radiodurans]
MLPSAPAFHVWTLPGGLTLAFERRAGPGFAFDLRVPLGSAHDPVGEEGSLAVIEEWLYKGAATAANQRRDARQLQDAFDDLGVRRGGGVSLEATRLHVSGLRADLGAALALVADVVTRPTLPAGELPTLLDLARQDLESLDDSPTDRLAVQARAATFPRLPGDPGAGFGHPISGTLAGLERLSAASLRAHWARFGQRGSVLGVVADADAQEVYELVAGLFADWQPGEDRPMPAHFQPGLRLHLPSATGEQTHLSLVAPGPGPRDPDWLPWQLALTALSGGSASRLFTRVREERGLAYEVSATPLVLGGEGFVSLYAGSTPANAPATLDVLLAELDVLSQGLSEAEFRRARTALTTGVVFGAESLRSRAYALTRDLALFGRVRPPGEVRAELSALTLGQVNAFLANYHPAEQITVVSLGPDAPDRTLAVSA